MLLILLSIIIGTMIIYCFSFLIIVHEGGHLFFGLLTGYQLVSFRIWNITLIKENRKMKIKKYSIQGSAGQCLMTPPAYKEGHNPFILYNLGGLIFDTALFILLVLIAFLPQAIPIPARLVLLSCAYVELISIIMNGTPGKKAKIDNDAANTYYMLKDKNAVKSYYLNMSIFDSMKEGKTYRDFPLELFRVSKDADLTNALIAWQKLNESYYYMDTSQWDKALACIREIDQSGQKRSWIWLNTLRCEMLFLYIILDKSSLEIEELYRKAKKAIKNCGMDFNLIRVRMAYELYHNQAESMPSIEYELKKISALYPYKGEADFCSRMVMDIIKHN